ncbi:MAG: metal-dependent hydrolase, partial [Bacteroidota bacterium]
RAQKKKWGSAFSKQYVKDGSGKIPTTEHTMLIGHFAVAFAAKKAAPKTSLGTLFLSVQFVDLLWPLFLLLGLEHVLVEVGNTAVTPLNFYDYPITHSLAGAVAWSLVFGGVYFALRNYKAGAWTVGLGVFSHWILDFITHRPDLPLGFGVDVFFGLGLWNSPAATVVVETALYAAGLALYLRSTVAKDKSGRYGLWGLVVVLFLIYLANLFGPPPPNEEMIAIAGNASWLFVLWAYWVDKHRSVKETEA